MKEARLDCPNGHGKMVLRKAKKQMTFRGVKLIVPVEQYRCTVCGVEVGTVGQAARIQKTIADAYRKAVNLLTGNEIVEKRKKLSLTQDALAKRMNVGIASVKEKWSGMVAATRYTG